ncbi:hypothetical protein TSMEX_003002 [Taenia solium]|eukprot:TsM_001202600 transcript=TsM_001202600 gene=TsM_001202600
MNLEHCRDKFCQHLGPKFYNTTALISINHFATNSTSDTVKSLDAIYRGGIFVRIAKCNDIDARICMFVIGHRQQLLLLLWIFKFCLILKRLPSWSSHDQTREIG